MNTRKHPKFALAATAVAALALMGCAAVTSGPAVASTTVQAKAGIPKAGADAATAVLVHGAFADSSSWAETIELLQDAGYKTVAFADPLRGVANDTAALQGFVDTIDGPVVLVGHSYAGMVVSQVAAQDDDVVGLVYVAAFIPEEGESVNSLNTMFAGSELVPDNLHFAAAPGGLTDVYINADAYHEVYAGGLKDGEAAIAAATQRPITAEALGEAATLGAPAGTPKWMIVATEDHAVPTEVQEFMAERAGATVTEVESGHDVPAVQPQAVAQVIAQAAN
jgi:pimeloyl-ACP methyl ester carboxylesterase